MLSLRLFYAEINSCNNLSRAINCLVNFYYLRPLFLNGLLVLQNFFFQPAAVVAVSFKTGFKPFYLQPASFLVLGKLHRLHFLLGQP